MEKKKIMAKSLTLLVTVASLLAVGISITAAAGLSANQPNSGSSTSYKQMTLGWFNICSGYKIIIMKGIHDYSHVPLGSVCYGDLEFTSEHK